MRAGEYGEIIHNRGRGRLSLYGFFEEELDFKARFLGGTIIRFRGCFDCGTCTFHNSVICFGCVLCRGGPVISAAM